MKRILAALIFFTTTISFGQNSIDLANVYYRVSPYNKVEDSALSRHLTTFSADVKLPLVINSSNVALVGLEFQQNSIQTTKMQSNTDLRFSSAGIQIGLEHNWNAKSKMLFMSMTRLNSDFKAISISDFQQGGLVLGTTKHSDDFDWKYGVYYNREFFGSMIVPLFGFNWKMNDHWRLKLIVPLNLELSYRTDKNLITGLRFDGVNSSFRTNQNPLMKDAYIDKADNNIWAFTEFEVGKNCWFHIKAGYSLLRKYRVYREDDKLDWKLGPVNFGDNRVETKKSFENGLSFEARFIYRLNLKDK